MTHILLNTFFVLVLGNAARPAQSGVQSTRHPQLSKKPQFNRYYLKNLVFKRHKYRPWFFGKPCSCCSELLSSCTTITVLTTRICFKVTIDENRDIFVIWKLADTIYLLACYSLTVIKKHITIIQTGIRKHSNIADKSASRMRRSIISTKFD